MLRLHLYSERVNATSPSDHVEFRRSRHLPGVELVSVAYRDRRFPEHRHDEVVIGAITAGAETLTVGRTAHVADVGSVLCLRPGEAHSNATIGEETLHYAVLYIPAPVFSRFLDGDDDTNVVFSAPVVRDGRLHALVCAAHAVLGSQTTGPLEQETALSNVAEAVHVGRGKGLEIPHQSCRTVEQVRSFIDAHLANDFSLRDLSDICGLSPFHLIRLFKRVVGVSPLAYRNQQRLSAARRLLADGYPTIEVALDLGFADQSHFTRHFQRIVGTSPQRYAKGIAGP